MKKILLLSFFFISVASIAQNFKLGITANPQISWMTPVGTDNIENKGTVFGFDVGLSMEKYFTDNYAILTGLSLNNIGGELSYADSIMLEINEEDVMVPANESMKYNFQYVKIPLALKFKTKEMGYFTYFAQIGLEGGVMVRSSITIDENDVNKENVSAEVGLFNGGYLIGGGIEYSLGGSTAVILGIQYQNGMVDVLKTTEDKVITPKVSFLFGIMF